VVLGSTQKDSKTVLNLYLVTSYREREREREFIGANIKQFHTN